MTITTLIEPLLTATSGSVGDVTHGRNQFGSWTRSREIPTDPATPNQLFLRQGMIFYTDRWANTLTLPERLSWTLYANNVPLTGRLGRRNFIGGLPHYIRTNVCRWQVTAPPLIGVDTAPDLFDLGPFTPITHAVCNLIDQTIVIFITPTDEWAAELGSAALIWLSTIKPDTIRFHKGPYTLFAVIRGNPSPLPTQVQTFPVPATAGPNEHYFLRGRVTRLDGRLSPDFRLDVSPAPQVPAVPIALERVVGFPPRFDVTFDDFIADEPHDDTNWFIRADETLWDVRAVTTVAGKIRIHCQAIGATGLDDRVIYEPPPFDVKGVSTSLPVDSFVFFPK